MTALNLLMLFIALGICVNRLAAVLLFFRRGGGGDSVSIGITPQKLVYRARKHRKNSTNICGVIFHRQQLKDQTCIELSFNP